MVDEVYFLDIFPQHTLYQNFRQLDSMGSPDWSCRDDGLDQAAPVISMIEL